MKNDQPVVGKTYRVTSGRFGSCTAKVTSADDEWIMIEITEGELVGMTETWGPGDTKGLRRAGTKFEEIVS